MIWRWWVLSWVRMLTMFQLAHERSPISWLMAWVVVVFILPCPLQMGARFHVHRQHRVSRSEIQSCVFLPIQSIFNVQDQIAVVENVW